MELWNLNKKLGSYIDMNTNLRKKAKDDLKKIFLTWWIMQVFWKTKENVRKYWDIQVVTTEKRRNYLVSEPN